MIDTFTSIHATMFLKSVRVLVTRPKNQAKSLAKAIESRLGNVWVLPMLVIAPLSESQQMRNLLLNLDQFDKIIVTSQNAARYGLALVDQYWPQLPVGIDWYAIGSQTATTMSHYSITGKTPAVGLDSEALLDLADLGDVKKQKVLIIKGKGGRTLISDTLKARGAIVEQLLTYERQLPDYNTTNPLPSMLRENRINTILCTSAETVTNLLHFLPKSQIPHLFLILPSQRVASTFSALPFRQIIVSEGASNEALLASLDILQEQLARLDQINKHSEELS